MKVIENTPERLVLQERPWLVWAAGLFFVLMGCAVMSGMVTAVGWDAEGWQLLIGWTLSFVPLIVGAAMLALTNVVTCTADLRAGELTLRRAGLLSENDTVYPLDEIIDFLMEISSDVDGETYRAVIVLYTQERIPITKYFNANETGWRQTVKRLRAFTGIGGGEKMVVPEEHP